MAVLKRLLDYSEVLARKIQWRYMAPRRTTEVVESGRVRFHPQDCREWVMLKYARKLKTLGLR